MFIDNVKFNDKGLVPAIAQDSETGEVLMLAYMNREALEKSVETGLAHYFSRSRQKLWMKGESSGHRQHIKAFHLDCDSDTLLIKVVQDIAACHTGHYSCFFRKVDGDNFTLVSEKIFDEEKVYGN
jgi:phosphoribosyl-ATP pyrophosphohydrolase/phosphoribosyl-AMP cyclohydrolase